MMHQFKIKFDPRNNIHHSPASFAEQLISNRIEFSFTTMEYDPTCYLECFVVDIYTDDQFAVLAQLVHRFHSIGASLLDLVQFFLKAKI